MLLETRPNPKIYIDLKLHRWFHQNKKQKKRNTLTCDTAINYVHWQFEKEAIRDGESHWESMQEVQKGLK